MSPKLSKGLLQILELLQKSRKPLSSDEIATTVGKHYQTVSRSLRTLSELGCIRKIPAGGNKYNYAFVTKKPGEVGEPSATSNILTMELTSGALQSLLNRWSQAPWQPKIFDKAQNLPVGLARLFELANEASYGSVINPADLQEVRRLITEFRQSLEQTLRVVNGVLDVQQLWNTSQFAAYLLQDSDPDQLRLIALQVKEKN